MVKLQFLTRAEKRKKKYSVIGVKDVVNEYAKKKKSNVYGQAGLRDNFETNHQETSES